MIGGDVWKVYRLKENELAVLVRGRGGEHNDFIAIDIEDTYPVAPGDGIWWQDRIALWSPKGKKGADIHLSRIGYSYRRDDLWHRVCAACMAGVCPECGHTECMHDGFGGLWCPACDASYRACDEDVSTWNAERIDAYLRSFGYDPEQLAKEIRSVVDEALRTLPLNPTHEA